MLICTICHSDMKIYYKDFTIMLYYCPNCFHFIGDIITDNCTNIFENYNIFKLELTQNLFNLMFYDKKGYMLNHTLLHCNIHYDLERVLKNAKQDITIYIKCKSYDNIKNSKNGIYNFYSTNSIKYFASKYRLNVKNMYILKDTNETIYELTNKNNISQYISHILYEEIKKDLYNDINV